MKVLLDTHAFIWWDSSPAQLSVTARNICLDRKNTVLLSVVCVWEMQIKYQLGKLNENRPLDESIADHQRTNGFQILPIGLDHVMALANLPPLHKDPFDRILIAQAITEDAALISHDPVVAQYPVKVIW